MGDAFKVCIKCQQQSALSMKRREMNEKKQHAIDIEDPYKPRESLSPDDTMRISLLGVTQNIFNVRSDC